MKRIIGAIISLTLVLVPMLPGTALAASASMSLSVSSRSIAKGGYVSVYVRENSGAEPVNAVQANFTYPANLLQYISISSSSAFSVVAQNGGGGGSVNIGRGAFPAVSGNQLIASVLFKALTNAGTASLAFSGGSSVVSANSNTDIATGKSGTSVTLTNPAPVAPKDTTPPTITGVHVTNVTTHGAIITWTTSEAASSEVDYGFTSAYGISASNGAQVTVHSLALTSPLIIAGTTYHFVVKSADAAGNSATGTDATFTTAGATVTVLVTDRQTNKPLAGVRVSWNTQTATTDNQGKATLTNLPPGPATLVVQDGTTTSFQTIVVAQPAGKAQLVAFKTTAGQAASASWLMIAGAAVLTLVVAIVSYLLGRRGRGSTLQRPTHTNPTSAGVVTGAA